MNDVGLGRELLAIQVAGGVPGLGNRRIHLCVTLFEDVPGLFSLSENTIGSRHSFGVYLRSSESNRLVTFELKFQLPMGL